MRDQTLEGKKMDAYVLLKILKYCTDSPARSYQMKFAVDQVFLNKGIDSTEDLGTAIKEIIHYNTIRGKFSSVHPDLAAEGITRVEVGEEGLHFIADKGGSSWNKKITCLVSGIKDQGLDPDVPKSEDEDEMTKKAIAMSLAELDRVRVVENL